AAPDRRGRRARRPVAAHGPPLRRGRPSRPIGAHARRLPPLHRRRHRAPRADQADEAAWLHPGRNARAAGATRPPG
ncbi:MAG: hypothetical protein AVDCRST_MAG88-4300, partial [uncultured Thermomicrobiales bacterium]